MTFNKLALDIRSQVQQLMQRGLIIDDEEKAIEFLSNVSYYRLSGYWWPMQLDKEKHIFKLNSRFNDVVKLYEFDSELRILLLKSIEIIEVSIKTKLTNHLSISTSNIGSNESSTYWYEDEKLFTNKTSHKILLQSIDKELARSQHHFLKSHYIKYGKSQRPPSWKTFEVLSVGNISKLYGLLDDSIPEVCKIHKSYLLKEHKILKSWLQGITIIRNLSAHHSRVWNENLPTIPALLRTKSAIWISNIPEIKNSRKIYLWLCCIQYLLKAIESNLYLSLEIEKLLDKYPNVDSIAMGFTKGWNQEPLWQN